jgi:hypothetical protein
VRRHGNFSLLAECLKKALGKEVFAEEFFAVYPLLSAALGKAFAEGKMACPWHSAMHAFPVVFLVFQSVSKIFFQNF